MTLLEFGDYTMDPKSINFVGKVEYLRDHGYGFKLIVNGSIVRIGSKETKDLGDALRLEFLENWKNCLARMQEAP